MARISEDAMTALSLVFPIQNFCQRHRHRLWHRHQCHDRGWYLGAGDREKAEIAATHGFVLSLAHGILMMAVSIAIMPGFLRRFTQDETLIAAGITYSTIVFLFLVVNMVSLAFEKIFQAVGRMKVSMAALITGCVCNIFAGPHPIFGLGPVLAMGIAGAALATGIGQLLSLCVYLSFTSVLSCLSDCAAAACARMLHWTANQAIGVPAILNLALPSLVTFLKRSCWRAFPQAMVVLKHLLQAADLPVSARQRHRAGYAPSLATITVRGSTPG